MCVRRMFHLLSQARSVSVKDKAGSGIYGTYSFSIRNVNGGRQLFFNDNSLGGIMQNSVTYQWKYPILGHNVYDIKESNGVQWVYCGVIMFE